MKCVTWIEPAWSGKKDGTTYGPVYNYLAVDQVVLMMREMHPYDNDEDALNDFIISHWGKVVDFEPS